MDHTQKPKDSAAVKIRPMTRDEVDLAVAWAAAEGWNPGRHDAGAFYHTDPQGFLVAEVGGDPVGCLSAVVYDDTFSFGGFFIVAPGHRRNGYGAALRQAALDHVGSRMVGLDGVAEQQDNYRKYGFVFAYNNIRFESTGAPAETDGVLPLDGVAMDELAAYDARFFPAPRPRFLEGWRSMPDSPGFAVRREGNLAGYGVIRPCASGYKIGPLFADSPAIAQTLYRALAAQAPGATVYLDVPEVNAQAMDLARRHGMREVFRTARMYMNGTPAVDISGVFGVTSFELG